MANFFLFVLVVGLIAAGAAEPPRQFNGRFQNRNRFFARQELTPNAPASPSAPTPYPPAGEKPDIPFELPTEEAAPFPEPTYGPPDQTYGPPDQTYGPPQTDEPADYDEQTTDEPEAERLVFVQRRPSQSSRLVLRNGARLQAPTAQLRRPTVTSFAKSARLRQSPARLQSQNIIAQPIILPDGTLVYSIHV